MWEENCYDMSLEQALDLAKEKGFEFYFNWDKCRTDEGYYKVQGSVLYSAKRGLLFSEYADMLWMETPTPDLKVAQEFANLVH